MTYKYYRVKTNGKYFAFSSIMERPIWLNGPKLAAHWATPKVPFELVDRFGGEVEVVEEFGGLNGKTVNRDGD